MWLNFLIVLLILFETEALSDSTYCCDPNEKIFLNMTCTDHSNLTLTCENKVSVQEDETKFSINVDTRGVLSISDDEDAGEVQIEPSKYCMGVDYENNTRLLLICVEENETEEVDIGLRILSYVRMICSLLSTLFFLAIVIIYIHIPELRDIEGKCIINYSIVFGLSHFLQILGPFIIFLFPLTCDPLSFINNFLVLCAYNWLTVMSVHIWRITIQPIFQTQMNWFLIYVVYGYGFPIILLITSVISHLTKQSEFVSHFENTSCWLEGSTVAWCYLYGPIIVFVIISAIIQLWAAKKLWLDIDRRDESSSVVRLRKKCLMYLHLLLVTGSMILLELALVYYPIDPNEVKGIQYVMSLLDCRGILIGGAVFFIFVVLRNKVLRALAKNGLCCLQFPSRWKKLVDEEEEMDREVETEETTLTRYNA